MMTFGSLFAGIGGFDLGLEQAGMTCKWQVEIDDKCNDILFRHWPDVERYENVKEIGKHDLEAVDVITGGFPCQDLSIAGKRKGLAGERSGLWFEFHRVLEELRPRWTIIENVPGLLSSNGGRDFAVILRGLAEIGYLSAWRVLDAQYYRVAQRRRRVFIVASLGNGGCAQVLFEPESLSWDTAPSREERQGVARPIAASTTTDHYDESQQTYVIGFEKSRGQYTGDIAAPLQVKGGRSPGVNDGKADNQCIAYCISENQRAELRLTPYSRSLSTAGEKPGQGYPCILAFTERSRPDGRNFEHQEELAYALMNPGSDGETHSRRIAGSFGVRRLTPTECERLQGFPDGWTDGQSDSARYRQLGNAVCVNKARWIGRQIVEYETNQERSCHKTLQTHPKTPI